MLFVGDDWAEDHHDVEVQDETGRRLARARLPEGVAGVARLHELIGPQLPEEAGPDEVAIGIETDKGPWVQALVAAGYAVYAVNPRQVARYRDRHGTSGAKSDQGDAHTLADMVRTDRHQLRVIAGDTPQAQAVKVVARAHQTLIWDRQRHALRLRAALLDFFPAALAAFDELTAPDTLRLLAKAPDPAAAARLSRAQVLAELKRAGRRGGLQARAEAIVAALRSEQLTQPPAVAAAYAATVRSLTALIEAFNAQIAAMGKQVAACFGQARDAEIYLSQPGLGQILAARALGEFGDDPDRYANPKARKNYAGTSPITVQSGKKRTVLARFVHNDRLADALHQQAFCALTHSPGARAYYDAIRARGASHHAALRQLANRLVGILHGCLKTRTFYDEGKAWAHNQDQQAAA
ncbi:MAG TPA: IS110 family transposase [Streptosporangiaceae bacterium]|nr:IS110 family transposase [Streptosporangiaceae bacterium]